jgi:hypothetical protein
MVELLPLFKKKKLHALASRQNKIVLFNDHNWENKILLLWRKERRFARTRIQRADQSKLHSGPTLPKSLHCQRNKEGGGRKAARDEKGVEHSGLRGGGVGRRRRRRGANAAVGRPHALLPALLASRPLCFTLDVGDCSRDRMCAVLQGD